MSKTPEEIAAAIVADPLASCSETEMERLIVEALRETDERVMAKLADPAAVHVNMLTGRIAKISMEQCAHIHGNCGALESSACWPRNYGGIGSMSRDPEDIARNILQRRGMNLDRDLIMGIADAIEAEREACAVIAETEQTLEADLPTGPNGEFEGFHTTKHGVLIAKAIRAQ